MPLELGLDTFGDVTTGSDGSPLPHAQVIRNVIAEAILADSVGLDFFGVGEHHRADFAVSAPEIVLAVIAGRTTSIRLGSSTTVLGTDDPVRVFQRFATLHAATNGRAEVILGRGWFTEPFPLFGHELSQYELLFNEKLDLFARLTRDHVVTWRGQTRPPLVNQPVFPAIGAGALRTWIAVGSTPDSVLRAASYDMPMILAIIGGHSRRFLPFVELYHGAFKKLDREARAIGVHSAGFVGETDEAAREIFWPHYQRARNQLGVERGWPPIERARFDLEVDRGSLYVGSPATVASKIVETTKTLGISRFNLKYSTGTLPHENLMRSIELYGTKVAPLVRDMLD